MPGNWRARLKRFIDGWLFRVGPVEADPIVLLQRRIFVLPTGAGVAFGVALIVMLLAAINYTLSLGHAFVFLLTGIGVASMVHAFRNLLRLELRAGHTAPVFAGEPAEFRLTASNPRTNRRAALTVRAHGTTATLDVPSGGTSDVRLAVPTHRRGWLPLGRTIIETTWPLGLVRAWSVFVPDCACLVYPTPEADPPPLPEGEADAPGRRGGRTGEDDFAGLRAHRRGDSPRHIAWKVVARGGDLLTKQFVGTHGGRIALDWQTLPPHLDDETRLSRLAAWVLDADARGIAFSLSLPTVRLATDLGAAHAHQCLRALAEYRSGAHDDA